MTATFTRPDPISSPTVVFFLPNNPIAPLENEKKRGYFQGCAPLLHLLEACDPKDPVCLHLHGDQPRGTSAFLVRLQVFELRHDSIGGKVTTGYARLRKAPTTVAL